MNLRIARLLGRLYRDEDKQGGGDGGAADAGAGGDKGAAGGAPGGDKPADGGAPDAKAGAAPAADGKDGKGAAPDANADGPWGADWRKKLAGDDEAKLKRAGRYADPAAIADSLFQLQDKIAKGELRSNLPKDATAEQITKWRAENGIPEAPDKYDLGDLKIADEDKAVINEFLKTGHSANMTPTQAKATIDWYYKEVERQTEARTEADKAAVRASEDALREDWGTNNYRGNMAAVNNLLSTIPEAARDRFMHGRLADGTPIMGDPAMVKFLHSLSLEINPAASLDIPSGRGTMQGIADRKAEIEKVMSTDRSRYNKDEKMQAEYRDLIDAELKMSKK
jgi:hypothetical protein